MKSFQLLTAFVLAASACHAAPARTSSSTAFASATSSAPLTATDSSAPVPTASPSASADTASSAIGPSTTTLPTSYNATGNLTQPEPVPYQPAGGANTGNDSVPVYHPLSDFDYQSLTLALYQEWIELDLFSYGLKTFTKKQFAAAGLSDDDRSLIKFMENQEVGHAKLISNMLGETAAQRCTYQYPFTTVRGFIDFCQKLTRWGEAGVYGFLPHLDSRAAAQDLLQSISTEAKQEMTFRQFEGLHPYPVFFDTGLPQSFAWTLLAPYIKSCPASTPLIRFQNFPALNITNNPDAKSARYPPAIATNRTALSAAGRKVNFKWDRPGKTVGPDGNYNTSTATSGVPKYAAWISQLNTTYTELTNVKNGSASTVQPGGTVFEGINDPVVNGTVFIVLTDSNPYVTPHNLSLINTHVVAGPAVYQSG